MKKSVLIMAFTLIILFFTSCSISYDNKEIDAVNKLLKPGDKFTVTGVVDYSDKPSDIGNNYCSVTGDVKIEYLYMDIYNEESQWSSNVFYTKGNDTILLKKYVGQEITVSGEFDAECHGIQYITNIEIV